MSDEIIQVINKLSKCKNVYIHPGFQHYAEADQGIISKNGSDHNDKNQADQEG